jgi:hypothetical protein
LASPVSTLRWLMLMTKIECERELSAFMSCSARGQPWDGLIARCCKRLTRRARRPRRLALAHDLIHFGRLRDVVLRQALDVDAARLLLVHLQVVVLGCRAVNLERQHRRPVRDELEESAGGWDVRARRSRMRSM